MGEESFYTEAVPEYTQKSRLPIMSRYRDLIEFVKAVFSDGVITDQELAEVEKAEDDILLEYQLAAEIYDKAPDSSPKKAAAGTLLMHLHRCNVLMSYAKGLARSAHDAGQDRFDMSSLSDVSFDEPTYQHLEVVPMSVKQESRVELDTQAPRVDTSLDKRMLDLHLTQAQRILMEQLKTPQLRIKANIKEMRKSLESLTPEERAEYEAQINAVLDYIERVNLESVRLDIVEMNRLLGLERYLHDELERVRDA